MIFAELEVGRQIEAGPYAVTADEILHFATRYDPQWFHTNPDAAAEGPFEGLIASGWHSCGIAMRLAVDHILAGSESYASPGISNLRWPAPVRPGDNLTLRVTVLEQRRSESRPDMGIIRWRWQLHNQDAVEVLDLEATSMFKLDSPEAA